MKPILILIAAVAGLALLVTPVPALTPPFESVAPMQEIRQAEGEKPRLANVCSATSINTKQHLWLTAKHCLDDSDGSYILGDLIEPVMKDETNDLAIVKTLRVTAPAVKLASVAPKLNDAAFTISYPLGFPVPLYFTGIVSNENFEWKGKSYVVFQFPVAPGSSGSPIFNANGELISITQRGFSEHDYGPLGLGVGFEKLQSLAMWWEK